MASGSDGRGLEGSRVRGLEGSRVQGLEFQGFGWEGLKVWELAV